MMNWVVVTDMLNYSRRNVKINLPTNFPIGILANMGPDFAGSLQAYAAISVQVTVGLTEFTRIYKITDSDQEQFYVHLQHLFFLY